MIFRYLYLFINIYIKNILCYINLRLQLIVPMTAICYSATIVMKFNGSLVNIKRRQSVKFVWVILKTKPFKPLTVGLALRSIQYG